MPDDVMLQIIAACAVGAYTEDPDDAPQLWLKTSDPMQRVA